MPRIVTVPLSLEQREQLIFLTKHAAHWRERQRAKISNIFTNAITNYTLNYHRVNSISCKNLRIN